MQSCWLSKQGSSCILFLAGWGMDPAPFRSITRGNHDILLVYDYQDIEPFSIMQQVRAYGTVHLVAWSMGVWVAAKYFTPYHDRFASITALNGTISPIDDQYGIPAKPFDEMIRDFSPLVLETFYHDMFDQPDHAERFLNNRPERPLVSIGAELIALKKSYSELGPGEDIFTSRFVGSRDRIFPARSQVRGWGKKNCTRIPSGHFPFYGWSTWDMVIHGGPQRTCD